jgi:hypothetical protein
VLRKATSTQKTEDKWLEIKGFIITFAECPTGPRVHRCNPYKSSKMGDSSCRWLTAGILISAFLLALRLDLSN